MIQFNPYFRKSASKLLKHSIFDSCREEFDGFENIAPYKIKLFTDGNGLFDYNNYTSKNLDIPQLKAALIQEIKEVRKMNLLE